MEDLDVDSLYNLLIEKKFPQVVAQRFKDQMIDGYILSKLTTIPISLIPELGVQIKFVDIFLELTGKNLEYPPGYEGRRYEPVPELDQVTRPIPIRTINNKNQQSKNNNMTNCVPYPAPLPVFSDLVEHYLKTNDCLKVVYLMNRELIDYYNDNNYDLSGSSLRNISQTVLDSYQYLNRIVKNIIDVENTIRNRRYPVAAFTFLTKKLQYRRRYVKERKERELTRLALINNNLTILANIVQNQQQSVDNKNNSPSESNSETPRLQSPLRNIDLFRQQQQQEGDSDENELNKLERELAQYEPEDNQQENNTIDENNNELNNLEHELAQYESEDNQQENNNNNNNNELNNLEQILAQHHQDNYIDENNNNILNHNLNTIVDQIESQQSINNSLTTTPPSNLKITQDLILLNQIDDDFQYLQKDNITNDDNIIEKKLSKIHQLKHKLLNYHADNFVSPKKRQSLNEDYNDDAINSRYD